jgi:predicted PurR-regulated permease PerM
MNMQNQRNSDPDNHIDAQLSQLLINCLDKQADELNSSIVNRLSQARVQATTQKSSVAIAGFWPFIAGAVLASFLTIVFFMQGQDIPASEPMVQNTPQIQEDVPEEELMSEEEKKEMYEWLFATYG